MPTGVRGSPDNLQVGRFAGRIQHIVILTAVIYHSERLQNNQHEAQSKGNKVQVSEGRLPGDTLKSLSTCDKTC